MRGQGLSAIVDLEDVEKVSKFNWNYSIDGYAEYRGRIKMHSIVLGMRGDIHEEVPDHINRNKLDNRKSNFRMLTNQQNCSNRILNKNNKTGYKGVSFHTRLFKWGASIGLDMGRKHIGFYNSPEIAALAYDMYITDVLNPQGYTFSTNEQINPGYTNKIQHS